MTYLFRSVSMLALLLLTACGFHLRGQMSTRGEISQLSVIGNDLVYIRHLSKAIERSGINISDQAPWRIDIISVERDVGQKTIASEGYFEQRIAMKVVYQLQDSSGLSLSAPMSLTCERYITQNQDTHNAAKSEQSIILSELQSELIATTLRHIHSLLKDELSKEAERVRGAAKVQIESGEPNRNTQP